MKILVLCNFGMGLYKFRRELLEKLVSEDHQVFVSFPRDEYVGPIEQLGCRYIETDLDRRGMNPAKDSSLFLRYIIMLKKLRPKAVLTYTAKANIYGGIACRLTKTPYLVNITGLGTALESGGSIGKLLRMLYKIALRDASCIFFQNRANRQAFMGMGIPIRKTRVIPGSGVNLDHHSLLPYPAESGTIKFLYVGRVMKAKGIGELLGAAAIIMRSRHDVEFHVVGFCEEEYQSELKELHEKGVIVFHGLQKDVRPYFLMSDAVVLPSYHEGMSNVLLEAAAAGRPVLATTVHGCAETFDEGVSGIGFPPKSTGGLVAAIHSFLNLSHDERIKMGLAGRRKVEAEYSRQIVVNAYLDEIDLARG